MSTKGFIGRKAILSILSGGTESDILDLGAVESIEGIGVCAANGSTTNIITSSIVNPVTGKALVVTLNSLVGKGITFLPDTTTSAIRNQKQLITGNTALGVLTTPAFTDAPAATDVFYITDLKTAKSYRRYDIQICSPATVTGTVNPKVSSEVGGTYYTQYSGGAAIVIPTATIATPIIPVIARFLEARRHTSGATNAFRGMGRRKVGLDDVCTHAATSE